MSVIKVSAKLDRTDSQTPWGFRMTGGKDYNSPLVIQKINPGSLSSKCGIKESDVITHIGGFEAAHLNHREAQGLIIGSGNNLELKLERSSGSSHNSSNDGYFQQLPSSLPWQQPQQQSYRPAPGLYSLAPKPFQKSGAVTTITSHVANLNVRNTSSPIQGHNVDWNRDDIVLTTPTQRKTITIQNNKNRVKSSHQGYGSPVQHHYGSPAQHHPSGPRSPTTSGGIVWRPHIPIGDRKMKIGRPGQAQRKPPMSGSARIPICTSCHTSIRGPYVTALDKTWCPDHFVCANPNCSQPLFDCGFVEEADQLYCEKDYEKYLAPRCARCSGAIVGEVVNAMKNTYHLQCFVCAACHQPIGTGSFHNEDGKIYCAKDWGLMFQTKCYGCQFPIESGDRWVEALSQNWHSECFNCYTCQINLEGQSFCAKNGKPYCKKHGATRRF